MIIELSQITEFSRPVELVLSPEEIGLEEELVKLKGQGAFNGVIEKHSYQTDIKGNIKGAAEMNCNRCLKPLDINFDIPFKSSYVSSEFESREKEIEIGGEDLDIDFYEGDKIDLTALVREQIFLNLDETALCKPDCLGLCQKCGANKNEKNCDCSEREIDPRFKVLENLGREKN